MPSPYTNGTPVTYINTAPLGTGRFVADGEKWGGPLGTAVTLTFSFPGNSTAGNLTYFTDPYPNPDSPDRGEWKGWSRLSGPEMQAVRTALDTWSHVANVTFVETTDNNRQCRRNLLSRSTHHARVQCGCACLLSPSQSLGRRRLVKCGDFNDDGDGIPLGSYDFLTIIHELGHALGLKHPFDRRTTAPPNISPAAQDNYFYSIMSYTASPWSAAWQTTSLVFLSDDADVLRLACAPGACMASMQFNTGNNVYTFNRRPQILEGDPRHGGH